MFTQDLVKFLQDLKMQQTITGFCSCQNIYWKFIPKHAPHFNGLWNAAVKSMMLYLRRIVVDARLTFEELATVIEVCLNSRPLTPIPVSYYNMEVLPPSHILIGIALEVTP